MGVQRVRHARTAGEVDDEADVVLDRDSFAEHVLVAQIAVEMLVEVVELVKFRIAAKVEREGIGRPPVDTATRWPVAESAGLRVLAPVEI